MKGARTSAANSGGRCLLTCSVSIDITRCIAIVC